jgi:Coenzyme PQQ synthesis protein D (PqqD)
MAERYAVRTDQTAAQEIDGEAIVINFQTNYYYGLNRTGTAVWKLLQHGGRNRADIADALAAAFRTSADAVAPDVDRLIDALLAEGLIQAAATTATAPAAVDAADEYVAPRLDKHEKLDRLMLSGE